MSGDRPSVLAKLATAPSSGVIGDGVYIAYQWMDGQLCRIYIGTGASGPILQFEEGAREDILGAPHYAVLGRQLPHPAAYYDGNDHVHLPDGAWTPLYSRGDYGKRYAYGGHWSAHCKNTHRRIASLCRPTASTSSDVVLVEGGILRMPPGVSTDLVMTEFDCSTSWPIWYPTAQEAMAARLTRAEIPESGLLTVTREHLLRTETDLVRDCVNDVIAAYNL